MLLAGIGAFKCYFLAYVYGAMFGEGKGDPVLSPTRSLTKPTTYVPNFITFPTAGQRITARSLYLYTPTWRAGFSLFVF